MRHHVPAGVLSERLGRTRVMTVSALAAALIGLLLPLCGSLPVPLVARAAQGVALAGVPVVAMAYLAEEVPASSLGAAMGLYVAGTTVGGLLGRLIPALTLEAASWPVSAGSRLGGVRRGERLVRPPAPAVPAVYRPPGHHSRDTWTPCRAAAQSAVAGALRVWASR